MTQSYFLRIGSLGEIWPGIFPAGGPLARGAKVVCRTGRGVELATVVAPIVEASDSPTKTSCHVLRSATTEDILLEERLVRHKRRAVRDCQAEIQQRGLSVSLLDVDHLFDGRTLIFHFVGNVDDQVQALVDELADVYERQVRSKHFAKLLADGCGPGCGTAEKEGGCGTGGCAVCVVASACNSRS